MAALARAHREEVPPPPSAALAGLDPAIEEVILACLEKDPAARPASARAVAAALPGDPLALAIAAGQTPSPERVAAAGESGRVRSAVAAALVAGTIAAAGAATWLGRDVVLLGREPLPKPPEALADRGRELAQALGYSTPADTAYEWTIDGAARTASSAVSPPVKTQLLHTGLPSASSTARARNRSRPCVSSHSEARGRGGTRSPGA